MPAELLRDVSRSSVFVPRRRWSMLPVSIGAHVLAAVAVIVIPLAAEVELPLPAGLSLPHFMVSLAPPPPPPAPSPATPSRVAARSTAAPISAAEGVAPEKASSPPGASEGPGVDGAVPVDYGVTYGAGMPGSHVVINTPPPPPPLVRRSPVRIGQGMREPRKLTHVTPVYPAIARENRVEGNVILEAIINERGEIRQVKVLRSVPLLDAAAVEAVRQWRYTPTLLNGVPVPVLMTIRVQFTIQR